MQDNSKMFGIKKIAQLFEFLITKAVYWGAVGVKAIIDGIKMIISMILGKY
jgi:hypothetical protein